MAYLRCESCGAKALVAASRCPKCANEFHLVDGRGERLKLAQCRGCGIMHRRGAACHWCPPKSSRGWRAPAVMQSLAATLLFAVIGGSTYTYGARVQDFVTAQLHREAAPAAVATVASSATSIPVTAEVPGALNPSTQVDSMQAPVVDSSAATVAYAVPAIDSVRWVPVVARTWVNIRNAAGRSGEVVGVIKPASRAMLGGTGRAGWRQVRSGDTTGWVDSRMFEADSLASRG